MLEELRGESRHDFERADTVIYTSWVAQVTTELAAHFNRKAAEGGDLLPGEFPPLQPGDHLGISLPIEVVRDREKGFALYNQIRIRFDDSVWVDVADHPRYPSFAVEDPALYRGGPTLVPRAQFPDGFFGQWHAVEVFLGERRVLGPVQRFVHDEKTGVKYLSLEDGPGKLVATMTRVDADALTGHGLVTELLVPILTDPVFGVPLGGVQIGAGGAQHRLTYRHIGVDYAGTSYLFNEGVLLGLVPSHEQTTIEVSFPEKGTGFACICHGGYTSAAANRPDARVY